MRGIRAWSGTTKASFQGAAVFARTRSKRHAKAMVIVAVGAMALFFPVAGSASPDQTGDSPARTAKVGTSQARTFINMGNREGAGISTCASNDCAITGWATYGDALYDYCYVIGEIIEPGGTQYWDFVYNVRTGASGYVNEDWLYDDTQTKVCS